MRRWKKDLLVWGFLWLSGVLGASAHLTLEEHDFSRPSEHSDEQERSDGSHAPHSSFDHAGEVVYAKADPRAHLSVDVETAPILLKVPQPVQAGPLEEIPLSVDPSIPQLRPRCPRAPPAI